MIADYNYFFERNVSTNILDLVAREFIRYSDNTYIAFLWPSGKGNKEKSELEFNKIVYKKEVRLTPKGGFNLLVELYRHMDWVGSQKDGYPGAKQKLIECFTSFDSFTVLVFQEESLEKVQEIKKRVRNIHNIGFSSIHITDTKEEAVRISNLIFNENGLHFLNYADPYKYSEIQSELIEFGIFLEKNNIDNEDVVIDGSTILAIYGLRKNKDIDYFVSDNCKLEERNIKYENHDGELKYHKKEKDELIYNPKYFFQYMGFKFISFNQLFNMKKTRGEEKDINDCNIMDALIELNRFRGVKSKIKQNIFYIKIKIKKNIRIALVGLLKATGLYLPARLFYRKFLK
jgi:hypothetical protein